MMDEPSWNHYILNLGFAPFAYESNSAQATIDIAWVKIYQSDPYDLYYDSEFDPDKKPTGDKGEDTTAEETTAAEETTVEETTPAAETTATEETTAAGKTGCGGVISFSAVAILSAMAAAVALKKKD